MIGSLLLFGLVIFADGQPVITQEVGWGMVVLTGLTLLKGTIDNIITWKKNSDDKRHDTKMALLEQEHEDCQDKWSQAQAEIAKCHQQHEESNRDREELRAENKYIRKELELIKRTLAHRDKQNDKQN